MESPSRHWRTKDQRYRLLGEKCLNCGKGIFPPRDVCPHCAEETKAKNPEAQVPYQFSGKGKVYSHSTIYDAPPEGFEKYVPYTVALVMLEEGPMLTAQLTDITRKISGGVTQLFNVEGEPVDIGTQVEMVTRVLSEDGPKGIINYGHKFRPLLKRQT
ncbi:MAG: Zn-ribbon domain-containing OB-fold protein [bacterium]|nr:Zn-ribbon domain-containing OB-fold protein [bacterium]